MKNIVTTISVICFLTISSFGQNQLPKDSALEAITPQQWESIVDSLKLIEGFEFERSEKLTDIGTHMISSAVNNLEVSKTVYRNHPDFDGLITQTFTSNTTTKYYYFEDLNAYMMYTLSSIDHFSPELHPHLIESRTVSCPGPDPMTSIVFTGTTPAALETVIDGTFQPAYETDHSVTFASSFEWSTTPVTGKDVWYYGAGDLQVAMYGNGIYVPYNTTLDEINACHNDCQNDNGVFGHNCPADFDPIDRLNDYIGDIGTCWLPGGPLEVIGFASGSYTEMGFSIRIFGLMVMDDAASSWGHFQNLTACSYASSMGYAYLNGSPWRIVTVNWATLTGAAGCGSAPITCSVVLPVTLSDWGYVLSETNCEAVKLNWRTMSELNNDYFELERAQGNGQFEVIGTIVGKGTSNKPTNYSFIDQIKGSAYYRLVQVDIDGQREVSETIFVPRSECIDDDAFLVTPNPSNGKFKISGLSASTEYELFNSNGQFIKKGEIQESLDLSLLSTGLYLIKINNSFQRIIIE